MAIEEIPQYQNFTAWLDKTDKLYGIRYRIAHTDLALNIYTNEDWENARLQIKEWMHNEEMDAYFDTMHTLFKNKEDAIAYKLVWC